MQTTHSITISIPLPPRPLPLDPQIYNLQDSYYSGAGRRDQEDGQESKEDEIDDYDEFEAPRPPPPAPTPMPATGAAGAPRSGQTRGGSNSRRSGSVGSGTDRRSSNGGFVDASSGAGGSGGYVAPSRLQEASLWSTAMEQAALERRMREASAKVLVSGGHCCCVVRALLAVVTFR